MNYFTKEELETIDNILMQYQEAYNDGFVSKIINKLKPMIDNYCDHNWDHLHPSGLVVCNECGKVYTDEP